MNVGMLAISLGLACAFGWGAADFCGGMASRRASTYSVLLVSELSGLALLLPLPFIFGESFPPLIVILISSLAGLGGTFGLFLLYRALAEGQMSIAAPVSGLVGAVIPVVVSALREGIPAPTTLIGFSVAALAIWMITASEGGGALLPNLRSRSVFLPMVAGVTFGVYFVLIHLATQEYTFFPVVFSRSLSSIAIGLFILFRRIPVQINSRPMRLALLSGVLDVIANLLYVLTTQLGRLDVAVVLASLYPGGTILLAGLILKERLSRTQQVGVAAALAAIALIAV